MPPRKRLSWSEEIEYLTRNDKARLKAQKVSDEAYVRYRDLFLLTANFRKIAPDGEVLDKR